MCPCVSTLLLLGVIGALIYAFLVWNFGYWKKRGIQEAKSYPFVGSFPSIFTQKRNVAYEIDDLYQSHKKTENFVGVFNGRLPQLLILNTDYAHRIFVNDFKHFHDNEFSNFVDKKVDKILGNNTFVLTGQEWKERRAEVTPGLTASRIGAVYPVTKNVCKSLVKYIKDECKVASKDGINGKELCLRYTTEVVSDCVLGIKANSFNENPTPIFSMIKKVFDQSLGFIIFSAISNIIPNIKKIYSVPLFAKDVETFFINLMETSIELRRKSNDTDRTDFLNYMLQLQQKKNLNTLELTGHTMTFLADGFETTATVLAHTLLLLARYPETQAKLRAEIGSDELTYEQLSELPYAEACLHESVRIFAPLLAGRKICTETYEFTNKDGTTVTLNPGDVVIVPTHSIHHDPEIYENPEDFVPERYLEENGGVKKYRDMGAYFGFGDGPRVCLGMRFALTQMKAALVEIVRKFNIKVNPKTRNDNCLDDTYFMALLKGGIWLGFEERY